jgi:hypothetical protein
VCVADVARGEPRHRSGSRSTRPGGLAH